MDKMDSSSQLKSSESSIDEHKKDKKKDSKKKKRKRSRSSSKSSSEDSEKRRRRAKKKAKKLKKKLKKKDKKEMRKSKEIETNVEPPKSLPSTTNTTTKASTTTSIISPGPEPPADTSAYKPMTLEEWTKKRNTYKHVIDPETGRKRLIRGDGEIVEECVSRDRQKEINKLATQTDGWVFHKTSLENVSKK